MGFPMGFPWGKPPKRRQDQDSEFAVILTAQGYAKRVPLSGFRSLRQPCDGGVELMKTQTPEDLYK